MAGTWTEGLEKALLLALLDPLSNFSRAQFEEASNRIGGPGWNACRQRFYKLKREAEGLKTTTSNAPATPTAKPATVKPAGKKQSTTPRKRMVPDPRTAADDDDEETPSKKSKQDTSVAETEGEPVATKSKEFADTVYGTADGEASEDDPEIA